MLPEDQKINEVLGGIGSSIMHKKPMSAQQMKDLFGACERLREHQRKSQETLSAMMGLLLYQSAEQMAQSKEACVHREADLKQLRPLLLNASDPIALVEKMLRFRSLDGNAMPSMMGQKMHRNTALLLQEVLSTIREPAPTVEPEQKATASPKL